MQYGGNDAGGKQANNVLLPAASPVRNNVRVAFLSAVWEFIRARAFYPPQRLE